MRESEIEKHLVDSCKLYDILCYKFTSPQRRSVPDRILIHRGQVVFVEVKAPKGRLTPGQEREMENLTSAGAMHIIVKTKPEVDQLIRSLIS